MNATLIEPSPDFQRIGEWRSSFGAYRGALVIPEAPDGRILLQMRDDVDGIAAPGKWGFFGGGIDPGEGPFEAVVRELYEEIGVLRPASEFMPKYAVLTGEPRWGLLYIFHLKLDVPASEIRVLEGAGFAWATRKQAEKLDLIWYLHDVLNDFWGKDSI